MEHVAILKKSRHLLQPILDGRKTIESRWYATRRTPWDRIKTGETVYFKETAEMACAKATVARVLQFEDLTTQKVRSILQRYGKHILIDPDGDLKWASNKRYCILIFLKNPVRMTPFTVDKRGFGNMAAWLSAEKISRAPPRTLRARVSQRLQD